MAATHPRTASEIVAIDSAEANPQYLVACAPNPHGLIGVFVIVSVEGEDALIESVDEAAPGRFPFHCKLSRLVPAESLPRSLLAVLDGSAANRARWGWSAADFGRGPGLRPGARDQPTDTVVCQRLMRQRVVGVGVGVCPRAAPPMGGSAVGWDEEMRKLTRLAREADEIAEQYRRDHRGARRVLCRPGIQLRWSWKVLNRWCGPSMGPLKSVLRRRPSDASGFLRRSPGRSVAYCRRGGCGDGPKNNWCR